MPPVELPVPITTRRLLIRPFMPGDGLCIFEAIEESKEQLSVWLPWVKSVTDWQDSEQTANEFHADFLIKKSFSCLLFQKDQLIGVCGFNTLFWNIPSAFIGYWCRTSQQGQGFMTEALEALTFYAFKQMKMKHVSILCHDENTPSFRLAERCGYKLEARTLGLFKNPKGDEPAFFRRYVRSDSEGIDGGTIYWPSQESFLTNQRIL